MEQLLQWMGRALVLLTAMPVHETAHGWVAHRLGDNTAKEQGRLSLNPLRHLDLVGSLLIIFAGFGWAKPVPVDARNFKRPKQGMALTALAGPLSNLLLALIFMTLYKMIYRLSGGAGLAAGIVLVLLGTMMITNVGLAVFNLLPVPPLDGSKILFAALPDRAYFTVLQYERYIALLLMVLLIFTDVLSRPLQAATGSILRLLDLMTAVLGRMY